MLNRMTDVVRHLLIINVIGFVVAHLLGIPFLSLDNLALFYPESENFQPYQIVTHFFMHGGIGHIFFNMFALLMFGSALETLWGPKRFLFFYFFCAIGAAVLHTFVNYLDFSAMQTAIDTFEAAPSYEHYVAFFDKVSWARSSENFLQVSEALRGATISAAEADVVVGQLEQYRSMMMGVPVVGASGAVYGLLLAFGMKFPNVELMLIFLPIPIKAKYFIPILMVVELFLGMQSFSWDNIAHYAHLGGALFGFLLIMYWRHFGGSNFRQV